ncbi:MarR family winged helix-turn-helix transcriptional regulator [Streptosporangium sp. NPDC004379]|uniref:MarR family winged helix-turn-helix transcriptional regulator n=1 Tax=Streptosporangium sp. NPDC004379 TaxID=3366189 RepID=UPI003696B954
MDPRHLRLVLGGGSLVNQVGRELRAAVEARLAPFGVTAQQAALLLHAARGEAGPGRLAAELGTDTAGMTRLLDRLEVKGLVRRRRSPEDRRAVVVEVTAEGRELVPALAPVFGRVARRLLDGFSAEEVEHLTGLLGRMLANLDAGSPGGDGNPPETLY